MCSSKNDWMNFNFWFYKIFKYLCRLVILNLQVLSGLVSWTKTNFQIFWNLVRRDGKKDRKPHSIKSILFTSGVKHSQTVPEHLKFYKAWRNKSRVEMLQCRAKFKIWMASCAILVNNRNSSDWRVWNVNLL